MPGAPKGFSLPYVEQSFRINRIWQNLRGDLLSSETLYGVISISIPNASPERLLELNRGHWSIENQSHYVRDDTFAEDHSQIRKGADAHIRVKIKSQILMANFQRLVYWKYQLFEPVIPSKGQE